MSNIRSIIYADIEMPISPEELERERDREIQRDREVGDTLFK